jgi:hypothetical protein
MWLPRWWYGGSMGESVVNKIVDSSCMIYPR